MRYDDYQSRYTPIEINDIFKTVPLNAHLITPSLEFSYSLCIEYMKEWFLKRFNKDFFGKDRAYVYVDGSHVFSEFNKLNKEQLLSRSEPNKGALAIVPTINDEFNREGIEDTMFGTDILVRRARHDDSFFKDKAHDRYASVQLTLINMTFTYKIRVETLAQQMDIFARMKQTFRVGYTWGEYIAMDYLIPTELILSMAIDAGYEVENGDIKNPIQFLNYMNSHSLWPILYKHRGINGLNEYFIRIPNMYVWINAKDISRDNGERIGHLNSKYTIEMNCEVRFPSAQYYVYHNTTINLSAQKYELNTFNEAAFEQVNAMRLFYIPPVNDKGWNSYLYTEYEDDSNIELNIDFTELFANSEIELLIKHCLSIHVNPNLFLDIQLYNNTERIPTFMDWETLHMKTIGKVISGKSYIIVYMDLKYMNEHRIDISEAMKNSFGQADKMVPKNPENH